MGLHLIHRWVTVRIGLVMSGRYGVRQRCRVCGRERVL